jgi:hypothetical protein
VDTYLPYDSIKAGKPRVFLISGAHQKFLVAEISIVKSGAFVGNSWHFGAALLPVHFRGVFAFLAEPSKMSREFTGVFTELLVRGGEEKRVSLERGVCCGNFVPGRRPFASGRILIISTLNVNGFSFSFARFFLLAGLRN